MEKYTDGKRAIYATERAYEVIYKAQGFKKVKKIEEDKINLNELAVKELMKLAKEKSIENYSSMKKEELIKALKSAK